MSATTTTAMTNRFKKLENCNRQPKAVDPTLLLGLVGRHVKVLKRTKWKLVSVAPNIFG